MVGQAIDGAARAPFWAEAAIIASLALPLPLMLLWQPFLRGAGVQPPELEAAEAEWNRES